MAESEGEKLRRELSEQTRRVQGLQMAVFSRPDPVGDDELFRQLAEAESKLADLQAQVAAQTAGRDAGEFGSESAGVLESLATGEGAGGEGRVTRGIGGGAGGGGRGRFLGEQTTGLRVRVKLQIDPLPTGAYHLMDPETDPLLTVDVENVSTKTRRICVKAYLEGLSATAVRTVEIGARKSETIRLQPTLFPERTRAIVEVQRATLHVLVEDLDGKLESHDTYPITCLARTASFNAVRRPETGETIDLSHYYGAWVTPHAAAVQQCIRRAVDLAPERRLLGYQGDPEQVAPQVAALYQALRAADIVYVNSVIDYGAPAGMTTQRTRLPRESLKQKSANCIDGTVLLASLMEGVSLNPAIVLVPGHAFVGWETWHGSDEWQFLETTLIGSADFDAARQSGQRQYEQFSKFSKNKIKLHSLEALRARGIWPME